MYASLLIVGLSLAAFFSISCIRSMALTVVAIGFLLVFQHILPSPDVLGYHEFIVLISSEVAFAFIASLIKAGASNFVACCALINVVFHSIGAAGYFYSDNLYDAYKPLLRMGESCQVISILLASPAVTKAVMGRLIAME